MRDPKFTSVFDSNSLLCVILFDLVWFKSICLYSFQKELDLTLTITVLPQFTCSEKSCHQEILARALHLVCSSLKELSSCVLWVSCTLSRILYKLHNFFLWEEWMEKKKPGDQTFSWPWNMCFTELRTYLESWWWVIVKRFFFHYMG